MNPVLPCGAAALAAVCLLASAPASGAGRHSAHRGACGEETGAPCAWTVHSPRSTLTASVRAGRRAVTVSVAQNGTHALRARVRVGAHRRLGARRAHVHEAFRTPVGKRRDHRLDAAVLTVAKRGAWRVDVLVADDGVAIRERGAGRPTFTAPGGSRAWLQRYAGNYEGSYDPVELAGAAPGAYGYPALIAAPAGTWALLSEAGLRTGQGASRLTLAHGELTVTGPDRHRDLGMSPWRLAVVGGLADVVDSDLPLSLGRPSRIADTSWIRPGRAAWSWWSDSSSPARLDRQRQYVDAAAARGWEYVLVDAGWDAAWMPELVRYAAARGVRVLLWTHWRELADPARRAALLTQWAAWGIAGIKADFLQSDGRARIAVYAQIARDAGERHLLVNFHGCTLPRGIQRTWPNVMTLEAVQGAEYAKGGHPLPAVQDVNLVFTRNAVGSMDYTPVTFSADQGTVTASHMLALAVAFESGLQHLADSPESYAAHPAADAVLRYLPAAWDDTRLIDGAPGSHATIARRAGADWWLASVHAGPAAERLVPLGFLAPGRVYQATVVADDGPRGLAVSRRLVTRADSLAVGVALDGGFTAHLSPVA